MSEIKIENALDPKVVQDFLNSPEHNQKISSMFRYTLNKPKTLRQKLVARLKGAYESIHSQLR